jgi:hypothetical protein
VQERLGHSSIAIVLDIYSYLMPNMQEGAAAAVDGVLRAAINKRVGDAGSKAVAESLFCSLPHSEKSSNLKVWKGGRVV